MPILGLLLGLRSLSDAEASGVEYEGNPAVLDRVGTDTTDTELAG
jgi:hypothetical protein